MSRSIVGLLKVTTLALVLSFGLSYVYAWTAPTATPPGGNVSAPLNTSATTQTKAGGLNVTGNVGVGTTAPASKLHVDGNPQTTNALLRVSTTDDNNGPAKNILAWNYVPGVLISNDWDGDAATSNSTKIAKLVLNTASGGYNSGGSIHVEGAGGYNQGQLVFSTGWDSSNNATERMRINASGNVGIGTAAPAQKLDVVGSAQITGTIFGGGGQAAYGATTIRGDKNGWSGINFAAASGANNGTLMMHPSYSGFYNAADNNWRMYVTDGGVGAYGNVYANDYYSNAAGKWMSQMATGGPDSGTICGWYALNFNLVTNQWGSTYSPCKGYNPGSSCPPGYTRYTSWSYGSSHYNSAWCSKD